MEILVSGSYNAFQNGFNGAGVYAISGLIPSSKFQTPIYFGSSIDLKNRILYEHFPTLFLNNHYNPILQRYYNLYGKENLVIFLVELTSRDSVLLREQYYLDTYRPFADEERGFNIAKDAKAPLKGTKWSKDRLEKGKQYKPTEETKIKISKANKGKPAWNKNKHMPEGFGEKISKSLLGKPARNKGKKVSLEGRKNISKGLTGRPVSLETRKKLSVSNTGKKRLPQTKNKIGLTHVKTYIFINPFGESIQITNLKGFCKENGLNNSLMNRVHSKKRQSHMGWRKF